MQTGIDTQNFSGYVRHYDNVKLPLAEVGMAVRFVTIFVSLEKFKVPTQKRIFITNKLPQIPKQTKTVLC